MEDIRVYHKSNHIQKSSARRLPPPRDAVHHPRREIEQVRVAAPVMLTLRVRLHRRMVCSAAEDQQRNAAVDW